VDGITSSELAPGIVLYDNTSGGVMDAISEIDRRSVGLRSLWEPSKVYTESGTAIIDEVSRNCKIFSVPAQRPENEYTPELHPDFFRFKLSDVFREAFLPYYEDYFRRHNPELLGVYENFSVLKYGKGQKFTLHVDDGRSQLRRVSLVHYANENYEGGEIVFPKFGVTVKPRANQTILFPSGFMYLHEVKPVISGERYAVVQWVS
jgi:hypothetical protein